MKKFLIILLSAVFVITSCAFGAQDESDAGVQDTSDAGVQAVTGYYIANYAQSGADIALNIIYESDLLATSAQAGTVIYNFRDDNTVELFDGNEYKTAEYELSDDTLTIRSDDDSMQYSYEFVDSLLILRGDEGSKALYSFVLEDLKHITIDDYSVIEIKEADVAVTDAQVDSYINSTLQSFMKYDEITEGTVEKGDLITISFTGVLEGEEEPFEGGSDEGLSFQLGSGALIEGFEDQLVGCEIGSTVEVQITFPDDYAGNEDLIGKNAVFTTIIDNKLAASVPELTDEWVQEFSAQYLPEQLDTVEAFRQYSREYLEEYLLYTYMLNALMAKTTIDGYNADVSSLLYNYSVESVNYMASYYGVDADTYVASAGYTSAQAYEEDMTFSYLNTAMIVNKILADQGILYTAEELDEALALYLKQGGSLYTVEEYKEQSGYAGMWIYTNLEYKYKRAMESLKDRVVLVSQEEEQAQEEKQAQEEEQAQEAAPQDDQDTIPEEETEQSQDAD